MESNQIPYQSFTNGKYFGLHNLILKRIKKKVVMRAIIIKNKK